MYICNCGKGHELTEEHYKVIDNGGEIRLQHKDCQFDIIIGADEHGPFEDGEEVELWMYSYDAKNVEEEKLAKATIFESEGFPIRMKCGHDANYRLVVGSNVACKECAYDNNGRGTGNNLAWEIDYEYMHPELVENKS